MTQSLLDRLTPAVAAHLAAPDTTAAYEDAFETYRSDTSDEAKRDALIEIMDEIAKTTKPLEAILQEAWIEALATASKNGLIQVQDGGESNTVFDDVWEPLFLNGWASLPGYRHKQLSESLAVTVRNGVFDSGTRPDGSAEEIAAMLLADIKAGTIAHSSGGGDYFTNWADGTHLFIEMNAWQPKLSDSKHQRPTKRPDDLVFAARINLPSGRVLVADSVRIDPAPEMLEQLRDTLGLSINYAWHRIMRTAQTANIFNMVDIAMGDDGPGLVRAAGGDATATVFAGYESDAFPEIASVCHDYWGTVMIDRERMVRAMIAMETVADEAAAEAQIDTWLEESQFHTEIVMEPGTWHFYWDDDRETLDATLRAAGIDAPEDTRFVLSRDPLPLPKEKLRDMHVDIPK